MLVHINTSIIHDDGSPYYKLLMLVDIQYITVISYSRTNRMKKTRPVGAADPHYPQQSIAPRITGELLL